MGQETAIGQVKSNSIIVKLKSRDDGIDVNGQSIPSEEWLR
jgi:hypothetical protein